MEERGSGGSNAASGVVIGPLSQQLAEGRTRLASLAPPSTARSVLDQVAQGLREPLRIAVAGRVNSGKSTLVNALLGQRIAPTDVSECTRFVTWYRFGVPERVEVVVVGGRTSHPLQPDGSMPPDLPVNWEE